MTKTKWHFVQKTKTKTKLNIYSQNHTRCDNNCSDSDRMTPCRTVTITRWTWQLTVTQIIEINGLIVFKDLNEWMMDEWIIPSGGGIQLWFICHLEQWQREAEKLQTWPFEHISQYLPKMVRFLPDTATAIALLFLYSFLTPKHPSSHTGPVSFSPD